MEDIIVRFLTYLVHFYVPIGSNRNFLVDTSSSNGVSLWFERDMVLFHRYIPDPPDVCNEIPGQPETLFTIKAICCDGVPYIYTKYEIKQNGFWLTKSVDLNILVPGSFSYSNIGTLTKGRSRSCSSAIPFASSIFTVSDWEDLLSTLSSYYQSNGGIVIGDYTEFIEYIQYPSEGVETIPCLHPLQQECYAPGWFVTLTDDFEIIIPWVPIILPSNITGPLEAILTAFETLIGVFGIDPNSATADVVYFIPDPVVTAFAVVSPLSREPEDSCFEDYYLRRVYLGVRFCPCPPGSTYVNGECLPTCPDCTVWNGIECVSVSNCLDGDPVPPPGYYFDGDELQPLPDPTPPPGGDYIWDGDRFVPRPEPPPGVSCPPGTHWDGALCVNDDPPVCPVGTHWDGNQCVDSPRSCPPGYRWNGVNCVSDDPPICPPGCYFDGEGCVCSEDDPNGPYLPPPDSPFPPPHQDYPSPRRPPPPGTDPDPVSPPSGKIDWPGSHLCAGPSWLMRGDVSEITAPNTFRSPGFYTYFYPYDTPGVGVRTAFPGIPGYPPPYKRYSYTAGSGEWYKVGTLGEGNVFIPMYPQATGLNELEIWVANEREPGIQVSAAGTPNYSPYWLRCGPLRGVYQIFAWFAINVNGVTCIPNPLLEWFINKFLATFGIFEGFQGIWLYRYEVFGPATESDPEPYVDMTSSPTGRPSFRWKMEWVEINLDSIYIPCLSYSVSLLHSYVRFQPYEY